MSLETRITKPGQEGKSDVGDGERVRQCVMIKTGGLLWNERRLLSSFVYIYIRDGGVGGVGKDG